MALGPNLTKEKPVGSMLDRVQNSIKKAAEGYFHDPLYYLLYTSLILVVGGLFFGMEYSWQFYAVIAILSGIQSYKYFFHKKDDGHK